MASTNDLARRELEQYGDWSYSAGTGSTTESGTGRIVGITVLAPSAADCWFKIGSGPEITVPANSTIDFEPRGLTSAVVVVTGSASWVVERVAT